MPNVKVHRINFFKPTINAVHCLAYDNKSGRLAVLRKQDTSQLDFSSTQISRNDLELIEIWDLQQKPFLEKVIPRHTTYLIETIAWCNGRLFSAGFHGQITEHCLTSLSSKYIVNVVTGCCVWCLHADKAESQLAAGTEDGHIVLYNVLEEGISFEKKFDKQEGRILCLAWHPSGDIIVTGSVDTIRIWNVQTGHVIDRIIVGRSAKNTETIVWCLVVANDMTIISGDSRGKTCFWDGKTGTLLSSLGTHKADVLALCLNKDEDTVYTAGVDPIIVIHAKAKMLVNRQNQKKWVKSVQRIVHSHDIRALALAKEWSISGGIDTNLVFCKYPPKTVVQFSPLSQVSYSSVAVHANMLLLQYTSYLEVWKLGETNFEPVNDGEKLPLTSLPVKLLQLKSSEGIVCTAISKDGNWIAFSTVRRLKLFHMQVENRTYDKSVILNKVKCLPVEVSVAYNLAFTSNNCLVISSTKRCIQILKCSISEPELLTTFEFSKDCAEPVHLLAVSENDAFVAAASHDGNVFVYSLQENKLLCKLPCYKYQATALAIDPPSNNVLVVYSDRKVVEYDLTTLAYTKWSRNLDLPNFQDSYYPIRGIVFTSDENKLLLYDESTIYVINKLEKQQEPVLKRIKESDDVIVEDIEQSSYRTVEKYKHLLDLHSMGDNQLIALELLPSDILETLPPPLYQKRYGT